MKRIISGIQPTGILTLGNYLGAVKNFVKLQNESVDDEILVFIADLHSITVHQNKSELRQNIKNLAALYIACGLDPNKVKIFIQSEIPAHNQLGYILECNSTIGELERMTQFKDKKINQKNGIGTGLLIYPTLMAADILLYDADSVPVGEDQKQHLELTRDLAIKFNTKYEDAFKVPEPLITKVGARIMSLTDPTKKMSKSDDSVKSYISLLDEPNVIRNKIKSAVTDLDTFVKYDKENKPGISNLMSIYSVITGLSISEVEAKFKDSNYQSFKNEVAETVVQELTPIQDKFKELVKSTYLDEVLDEGRDYASKIAYKKINKIYNKIGLGRKR